MTPTYSCIIFIQVFLISINGTKYGSQLICSFTWYFLCTERFKYDFVWFFYKFYTFVYAIEWPTKQIPARVVLTNYNTRYYCMETYLFSPLEKPWEFSNPAWVGCSFVHIPVTWANVLVIFTLIKWWW